MRHFLQQFVKKSFCRFGFDIVRASHSPTQSFLGLKRYPVRTIIDVGANEGQFSRIACEVFPGARIYAFEPLPEPFEKLKKWSLAFSGRVSVFQTAMGQDEGTKEMLCHSDHDASSSMLKTTGVCQELYPFTARQNPVLVKCSTLDKFFNRLAPDVILDDIFVKLDVQGYEEHVIRGGLNFFRRARACLLEVNLEDLYVGQADFMDIARLLDGMGYRYAGTLNQVYESNGRVVFADILFIRN